MGQNQSHLCWDIPSHPVLRLHRQIHLSFMDKLSHHIKNVRKNFCLGWSLNPLFHISRLFNKICGITNEVFLVKILTITNTSGESIETRILISCFFFGGGILFDIIQNGWLFVWKINNLLHPHHQHLQRTNNLDRMLSGSEVTSKLKNLGIVTPRKS